MITGIMAYANSKNWEKADEKERGMMMAEYLTDVKDRGLPVIVKEEIIWSKDVEVKEGELCPFCSWNHLKSVRGFVKIIDPYYQGFFDKGGVWARCPHQTRGYLGGGRMPLVKISNKKKRRRFFREDVGDEGEK